MYTYLALLFSPVLAMSSKSWFLIWMMLEMSSVSFIMVMIKNNKATSDGCMKYFLVQSIGSCVFLMAILSHQKETLMSFKMDLLTTSIILALSVMLKSGMFPTHSWLVSMPTKIKIFVLLTLLTWQKIVPMMVMTKIFTPTLIYLFMLSILWGTLAQLNIMNTKIILTVSSINHMGVMMVLMAESTLKPFIYLAIYSVILWMAFYLIKKLNIKSVSSKNFNSKSMMLTMISLAGVPPTTGFLLKWMTIGSVYKNLQNVSITLLMMMLGSINFFIYMRMSYSSSMLKSKQMKINYYKSTNIVNMVNLMTPMLMINMFK